MPAISVNLPDALKNDLRDAAQREGISINQFITLAVAEKISALKQADRIAHYKSKPSVSREQFLDAMNEVQDVVPIENDRLELET